MTRAMWATCVVLALCVSCTHASDTFRWIEKAVSENKSMKQEQGMGMGDMGMMGMDDEDESDIRWIVVEEGINCHNGEFLVNFNAFGLPNGVMAPVCLRSAATYNEGGSEYLFNATTSDDAVVSTTSHFADTAGIAINSDLANQELADVPVNWMGSASLHGRVPVAPMESAAMNNIHRMLGSDSQVSVGEFKAATGLMESTYMADKGMWKVNIGLFDHTPNMMYTLWSIVIDSWTGGNAASLAVVPFGGLPNVIITDWQGFGHKSFYVPYNPVAECTPEVDNSMCLVYVSIVAHTDHGIYGGGPDLSSEGLPAGLVGHDHSMIYVNGEALPALQAQLDAAPAKVYAAYDNVEMMC